MQPLTPPPPAHVLRRPTPPAAATSTLPPPPLSASCSRAAPPPLRPPLELPLPSALVPPKKRRVFRTPPKATTPLPPPPPVVPVAVAVPAPTPPPHAESPLFSAQKPPPPPHSLTPSSPPPPPPPPAEKLPSPPPPPSAENHSSPPPPPFAEEPFSPPPLTLPLPLPLRPTPPAENPNSPPPPPPPPAVENPSLPPPPPPPSAADEKPSARPATDAASEPAPAPKPRKITRKVRRRVPKGTIAARKAAADAASAAVAGASQPGKGHAPDNSSRNAAAADELVQKEQSIGGNTIDKPPTACNAIAVCETQLGKGTAVCETLLCKGTLGGGTLADKPATDIGGEHEEKKLGSRGENRTEVGMSERQRRRMTEVFVGGLNRDAKEEDVRAALSVAGEITEVRMIMEGKTKKNKGYCFVRYREIAQARKAIARFSNVKICGKQCRVAAPGGNDKIFLGNIDKKWKKEDIMKLLLKIGVENIDVVTLLPDSNNPSYNRGFAFLELESYRDAQIAYRKLSKKDVFGKGINIRVDWAEPDKNQMQKVNIRVSLAKSVQKEKNNTEDDKFYITQKDETKTSKSERKLGPSSLHVLSSSSRAVPITGYKSSMTHGFVQVLKELAPWRHENTASGSLTQNYPLILSGEKRPFSALELDSQCMSRNPHRGHERNTYATPTKSYSASPPSITRYSPYHHEGRKCLLDPDSVLSEPWGAIQMRQDCSRK